MKTQQAVGHKIGPTWTLKVRQEDGTVREGTGSTLDEAVRNLKPYQYKVAYALVDDLVRSGAMWFRAPDPGAHEPKWALFRFYREGGAWELLQTGTEPPYVLQKFGVWRHGEKPAWWAMGAPSLEWLAEPAQLLVPAYAVEMYERGEVTPKEENTP